MIMLLWFIVVCVDVNVVCVDVIVLVGIPLVLG